jgi:hypothetical protein
MFVLVVFVSFVSCLLSVVSTFWSMCAVPSTAACYIVLLRAR